MRVWAHPDCHALLCEDNPRLLDATSKNWAALLRRIYWARWSITRLTWMRLHEASWTPHRSWQNWIRRRYTQWRESAVVEEVNHHLRDLEKRETSNGMSTEATLWHKTIRCGVLNERSTQALTVSEWEYDNVRKGQEKEVRKGAPTRCQGTASRVVGDHAPRQDVDQYR